MITTTTTPTTTTRYPRIPVLSPRGADETAEAYGLRALLFVTAERVTGTVDTAGLQLAAHCYRLAVCSPGLTSTGADRLAEVARLITATLAHREALDAAPTPAQTPQAPAQAPQAGRPGGGQRVPRTPPPAPQRPPSGAAVRPVPPVVLAPVAAAVPTAGWF